MITIKRTGRYSSRLNFIDDKDNFVGWDDATDCCEDHFYGVFMDAAGQLPVASDEQELSHCSFDLSVIPYMLDEELDQFIEECGGVMVFELLHYNGEKRYLLVGNDHNGYYSHNYEYSINGNKDSGSL